jgi:hypothetical protein
MECYIIGFVIMLIYTIKEISETKYHMTFKDYLYFFFGLLIWPVLVGVLFYDITKKLKI